MRKFLRNLLLALIPVAVINALCWDRTMQTYRDTGKLPYSQINNKIYYKASDVETFLLSQVRDNSKK